ncbi:DEAD/DEAH box helicase [Schaalia sp. lx-100]|uniref:DEAD/DEAH box helicase n=1 Tax=Schaalia sp. lx-100 TaxID=2899081 RepID=UPI001E3F7E73|nr:DEAD/DEAH box helicase [Schaalia sp. lx-100]
MSKRSEIPPHTHPLLDVLRSLSAADDRFVHFHTVPQRQARYASWPQWVHSSVVAAWQRRGARDIWSHQRDALDALHEGHDVVVATGTGSGKSLVAWTPILSDLMYAHHSGRLSDIHSRPTCLYIAPTKALAADQCAALDRIIREITADDTSFTEGSHTHPRSSSDRPARRSEDLPRFSTADGDTPREAKEWARAHADLLLTNPDFLHHVMLPQHERWRRFFASLRYIVIDELHYWRGITGSHIAMVIRRLLRIAHRLGVNPQVIMLSATVRDPHIVGQMMTGRPCCVSDQDGSPAGQHHIVLWQGHTVTDDDVDIDAYLRAVESAENPNIPASVPASVETSMRRVSASTEAAVVTAALVESGARMLTFVRSRSGAESVAAQVKDRLRARRPEYVDRVAAYRGGYLPNERRALEVSLREGTLRALSTTSALELGLDISGLDATVTAGWPGTRASLWQQIGRAGRAGHDVVSVLIASENPLDSYIVHHPEEVFSEVEASVIDPSNPWVVAPHLCAAAAEFPLCDPASDGGRDLSFFGADVLPLVDSLVRDGFLRRRSAGWVWDATRPERPTSLTDLRGAGDDVQVVDIRSGAVIGTVDNASADTQVFPDAIYVHQGRTFHVLSLDPVFAGAGVRDGDEHARVAVVEEVSTALRTRAQQHTHVEIESIDRSWTSPDGALTWHYGRVIVSTRVTDFDLLRLPGLEFIRNKELSLPTHYLPTQAVWYTLSAGTLKRIGVDEADAPGALHAAEHASIALLPLLATCDRWDLGGLSTTCHDDTGLPTVFVHDAYRGGAGHAQCGYDRLHEWLRTTVETVRACPCEDGCPRCVQSPKCGNGNEPLSKSGAIAVLSFLVDHCPPM